MNLFDPNDHLDPAAEARARRQARYEAVVDAAITWNAARPQHRFAAWDALAGAVAQLNAADMSRNLSPLVGAAVEAVRAGASLGEARRERPDGRKLGQTDRVADAATAAKRRLAELVQGTL